MIRNSNINAVISVSHIHPHGNAFPFGKTRCAINKVATTKIPITTSNTRFLTLLRWTTPSPSHLIVASAIPYPILRSPANKPFSARSHTSTAFATINPARIARLLPLCAVCIRLDSFTPEIARLSAGERYFVGGYATDCGPVSLDVRLPLFIGRVIGLGMGILAPLRLPR